MSDPATPKKKSRGDLSIRECARLGGLAVKAKYGREHFQRMNRKSVESRRRRILGEGYPEEELRK